MNPRYERNVPALTEAECKALGQKRVLVVGCGGIGGYLIDMLARVGVGGLKVVDGDVFEPSNLNRQLLSDDATLGKSKAKAAAAWVGRVNPEVDVEAVAENMTRCWMAWTIWKAAGFWRTPAPRRASPTSMGRWTAGSLRPGFPCREIT